MPEDSIFKNIAKMENRVRNAVKDYLDKNPSKFKDTPYSIRDTGLTSKVINDWSEKGLISRFRTEKWKWHKFSLLDLFEILLYKELRQIGFSIKKIKKIKANIKRKVIHKDADYLGGIKEIKRSKKYKMSGGYIIPESVSEVLISKIILAIMGHDIFLVTNGEANSVSFDSCLRLSSAISMHSEFSDSRYYSGGNSLIIISFRKILFSMGVGCEALDESFYNLLLKLEMPIGSRKMQLILSDSNRIKEIIEEIHHKYNPSKKIRGQSNESIMTHRNDSKKITSVTRIRRTK